MWNVKWCESVKQIAPSSLAGQKKASGKQSLGEQLWKPTSHPSQWHISMQNVEVQELPATMEFCAVVSPLYPTFPYFAYLLYAIHGSSCSFSCPPVSGNGTTYGAPLLGSSNRWTWQLVRPNTQAAWHKKPGTPQLMRLSPKDVPPWFVIHNFGRLSSVVI